MNPLRKGVVHYLKLRRGLGFKLVIDERHLWAFIAFLEDRQASHITTQLALDFATFRKNIGPRSWLQRLCAVRAFAAYWQVRVRQRETFRRATGIAGIRA